MSDQVRLKLLYQIIEIANSSIDLKERLEQILDAIVRALRIKEALLFLQNQDSQAFVPSYSSPRGLREKLPIAWQPSGEFISSLMLHRQPILLTKVAFEDKVLKLLNQRGTVLLLPVFDDRSLYGLLALVCHEPPLSADGIMMQAAARAMAGSIRNYAHYLESRKRITELSLLADIGKIGSSVIQVQPLLQTAIDLLCRFLGAGFGVIGVKSSDGEEFTATFGNTPAYFKNDKHCCRPCHFEAPQQEKLVSTQLNQRLPFQGNYYGRICLFEKMPGPEGQGPYFSSDERHLLDIMCTMLAPALENALNFRHVQALADSNAQMVQVLAALFEIGNHLLGSTSFRKRTMVTLGALVHEQGFNFARAAFFAANHQNQTLVARAVINSGEFTGELGPDLALLTKRSVEEIMERYGVEETFSFSLQSKSNMLVKALKTGKLAVIGRPPKSAGKNLWKLMGGEGAWIIMPLSSRGRGVGVFLLRMPPGRPAPGQRYLTLLKMLADQAEMALEGSFTLQTLRKAHQELASMRLRLLEADRLAALGEIVSGMAHEIRNPLMTIGGFARRARKKIEDSDENAAYLDAMLTQVARIENLLSAMFVIPYDPSENYKSVAVQNLLDEALSLLGNDMAEAIEVERQYQPGLPPVYVDERLLKQAFFNIMLNAVQAVKKRGKIILRTRLKNINNVPMVGGEVEDSGGGVSMEAMHSVFNPFFTTKAQGSGLGLSYAHQIVSRHHGLIEFHNQGEGAAFVIYLPASLPGKNRLK